MLLEYLSYLMKINLDLPIDLDVRGLWSYEVGGEVSGKASANGLHGTNY